jgi:hypothetical protein
MRDKITLFYGKRKNIYINPPLHTSQSQLFTFMIQTVLNNLIIIFIEVITVPLFIIILIFTGI